MKLNVCLRFVSCLNEASQYSAPGFVRGLPFRSVINSSIKRSTVSCVYRRFNQKTTSALLSSIAFAASLVKQSDESRPSLKVADPQTLTYSYLISQAISLTVEAASQVLMQTTLAILESELKYRQDVEKMLSLLEQHATVRGNSFMQEQIWTEIVAIRSESETKKKVCNELELFLNSVKKMVEAAAESAFQGNCDYCSVALSERLQSAIREIDDSKSKTKKLERDYLKLYSIIIKTEKPPEDED